MQRVGQTGGGLEHVRERESMTMAESLALAMKVIGRREWEEEMINLKG